MRISPEILCLRNLRSPVPLSFHSSSLNLKALALKVATTSSCSYPVIGAMTGRSTIFQFPTVAASRVSFCSHSSESGSEKSSP